MKLARFNKSMLYLRRDPDAGWTLAVGKWRVFFQVVQHAAPSQAETVAVHEQAKGGE